MHGGWVYILTNRPLYIGVTSNLARRLFEHREGVADGFTKRYGLKRVVLVERYDDIRTALQRERLIPLSQVARTDFTTKTPRPPPAASPRHKDTPERLIPWCLGVILGVLAVKPLSPPSPAALT